MKKNLVIKQMVEMKGEMNVDQIQSLVGTGPNSALARRLSRKSTVLSGRPSALGSFTAPRNTKPSLVRKEADKRASVLK